MRIPFLRPKPEASAAKPARSRSKPPADDLADIEAARTQARRRLVGALVLLVIGVVGFPVLFETQPRPLPMDTPIVAPRREAVASGQVLSDSAGARAPAVAMPPADAGNESAPSPAAAASANPVTVAAPPASVVRTEKAEKVAAAAPGRTASAPGVAAASSTPAAPTAPAAKGFTVSTAGGPAVLTAPAVSVAKPMAPAAPIATASSPAKPAPAAATPVPAPKAATVVAAAGTAGASVPASAAAAARYVVQAGAYSEAGKLREARAKIEGLGLKTYTQVIEAEGGSRTRVRVGPFNNKAEAEAVAAKIKRGGVPAAVLAL